MGDTGCAHTSVPRGGEIVVIITLGFLYALSQTRGTKRGNFRVLSILERPWGARGGQGLSSEALGLQDGNAPSGLSADPPYRKGEKKLSGHKMGRKEGKNGGQLSGHVVCRATRASALPRARRLGSFPKAAAS